MVWLPSSNAISKHLRHTSRTRFNRRHEGSVRTMAVTYREMMTGMAKNERTVAPSLDVVVNVPERELGNERCRGAALQ